MKKMTFILSLVFVMCLSMTMMVNASVNINETSDVVLLDESNLNARNVVLSFFEIYIESLENLTLPEFDGVIDENEDTLRFIKSIEYNVKSNQIWDVKQINSNVTIDYLSLQETVDGVNIEVLMSSKHNYNISPTVESGIGNVYYKFYLKELNNGFYEIKDVETDDYNYLCFNEMIDNYETSENTNVYALNTLNEEQIIEELIEDELEFTKYAKNMEHNFEEEMIEEPVVAPYALTVTYNNMLGRNYAQRFAEASESSRWFYTVDGLDGGDCTNFVSQCVWAGYGGYVEGSTSATATQNNIRNQYRMTSSWYGGTGGGSPAWESVQGFWNYMTTNTGYGPKATGYNNGYVYTNIAPLTINYGDVLQFNSSGSGDYAHSVYVTYTSSATDQYSEILVSAHTNDVYNAPLTNYTSSRRYMRRLDFQNNTFSN